MTEHPPAPAARSQAPDTGRRPNAPLGRHPATEQPGGISIERVAALVECASGADTAAIEGLEAIVANLRRARTARDELAATVPPELLRRVLIGRASSWPEVPGHAGQPTTPNEAPAWPEGRA